MYTWDNFNSFPVDLQGPPGTLTGTGRLMHTPAIRMALARRAALAYSGPPAPWRLPMPTRTASMTKKLAANGQALHRAMMSRAAAGGAANEAAEAEAALLEERRLLKEEREKRKAQALQPRPSALDRLVRTHHPQPKDKPKAKKASEAHDAKKPKAHRTRAEKHAEKAAALQAARSSHKKPAK
jgi:hypothetical protein